MIEVTVDLGERSYPVLVGAGARHRLPDVLPHGVGKVAVVTQSGVGVAVTTDTPARSLMIEDGERAKTLETVEELCREFAQMGLSRRDCVVAVGGGLVTDVAGFAAAMYHRGVAMVHVPTTLLAQVDAAIGGKTGVNLPEGKNLVGAFWQPSAVLCDTETLSSLPPREYRSGTGEMAKYHFLGEIIEIDMSVIEDLPLDERIAMCVRLKAAIVAIGERESGRRAVLNYGHTLGHALEVAGDFDLRHGEAVAVGLHFAALLALRLGRIDSDRVQAHLRVLDFYGLPKLLPSGIDVPTLVELMSHDKKASGELTFVLDGPNGPEVVDGVQAELVVSTLEELLP